MRFFAEESVCGLPEFAEIDARLRPERIQDYQQFRLQRMNEEKKCVLFARKRGKWLKPFHCYSHNPEYRYFSVDVAEGCSFDCVYCYLQSYLNHGALVLFVDLDGLQKELSSFNGERLWLSTGLLSDSLLSEKYYPVLSRITRWIPAGSILEVRSKADCIEALRDPQISRENLVVSWSVNPESVAKRYEYRAATTEERLAAARAALSLGYRIGFHLDPVFHFERWREEYAELLESIRSFPLERIAFLSIGLFRFMPGLGSIIRKRFPFHPVLTGEFFIDRDGKYHYMRAIRQEMHRAFSEWLAPWHGSVPLFYAMEPDRRIVDRSRIVDSGL